MKLLRLMTLCVLLLGLSACSGAQPQSAAPTPQLGKNIGDGGLISGEPCGPPCLMGITPGITTVDEAASHLENVGLSDVCKKEVWWIGCPDIPIFFHFGEDKKIVAWIVFSPTNVNFGDVVAKYGSPSRWNINVPTDEAGRLMSRVTLQLFYDEIFTVIDLEYQEREDAVYNAMPESKVLNVTYTASVSDQGLYSTGWHGYGEYKP